MGLGQIGMGYDFDLDSKNYVLSHARSFSLHSGFELVGGVDPSFEKCRKFENKYGKPGYTNLEQALLRLKPSVVIISTPSGMHGSTLKSILAIHRPKAVVCEKPLDNNLKIARQMITLCNKNNIQIFVNYMRRSEPSVIKIKKMINEKFIKPPITAVVSYSKGILNNGSHMFNLLEYWLGSVQECVLIKADERSTSIDPEPNFKVVFEQGSADFFSVDKKKFLHVSMQLESCSGKLFFKKGGEQVHWQQFNDNNEKSKQKNLELKTIIENDMARYQLNFTKNLYWALTEQEHNICSGLEALETLIQINKVIGRSLNEN